MTLNVALPQGVLAVYFTPAEILQNDPSPSFETFLKIACHIGRACSLRSEASGCIPRALANHSAKLDDAYVARSHVAPEGYKKHGEQCVKEICSTRHCVHIYRRSDPTSQSTICQVTLLLRNAPNTPSGNNPLSTISSPPNSLVSSSLNACTVHSTSLSVALRSSRPSGR